MNYIISYCIEYQRYITAINCDSTAVIPVLANQLGSIILAYNNSLIDQVVPGVNVYILETENANLVGYFALKITNGVSILLFSQNRPAFQKFSLEISQNIANFIQEGGWAFDCIN